MYHRCLLILLSMEEENDEFLCDPFVFPRRNISEKILQEHPVQSWIFYEYYMKESNGLDTHDKFYHDFYLLNSRWLLCRIKFCEIFLGSNYFKSCNYSRKNYGQKISTHNL